MTTPANLEVPRITQPDYRATQPTRLDVLTLSSMSHGIFIASRYNGKLQLKLLEMAYRASGYPTLSADVLNQTTQNAHQTLASQLPIGSESEGLPSAEQLTDAINIHMACVDLVFNRRSQLGITANSSEEAIDYAHGLSIQQRGDRRLTSNELARDATFLLLFEEWKRIQLLGITGNAEAFGPQHSSFAMLLQNTPPNTGSDVFDAIVLQCRQRLSTFTPEFLTALGQYHLAGFVGVPDGITLMQEVMEALGREWSPGNLR